MMEHLMFLGRRKTVAVLANATPVVAPSLGETRGIVIGVALSAVLWALIVGVVWWLAA